LDHLLIDQYLNQTKLLLDSFYRGVILYFGSIQFQERASFR
jgi:hypothetical protein